jgi:hypothetical protein
MKLEKRLELLKQKVQKDDFLSARGLGNEIPFWIFDYPPEKGAEGHEMSAYHACMIGDILRIRHKPCDGFTPPCLHGSTVRYSCRHSV